MLGRLEGTGEDQDILGDVRGGTGGLGMLGWRLSQSWGMSRGNGFEMAATGGE